MPLTSTVPVTALVTPRLIPCRARKVPRVTMKLGSPVRITIQPLNAPTASANTSDTSSASHTFQPALTASSAVTSPVDAVITPADRSNSPPIMSSATGTAISPRVEASSNQLATPPMVRKLLVTKEKNRNTSTAPSSALISGRTTSRSSTRDRPSRSSAAGADASTVATALPGSPLGILRHLVHIGLVDETGPGQHRVAAAHRVRVVRVQLEHHDRQVALLVLLLVDREQHVTGLDRGDHVGVQVERGDLGLGAGVLGRARGQRGHLRVQREHRVDRRVGLQRALDPGLHVGRVGELHLEVGR